MIDLSQWPVSIRLVLMLTPFLLLIIGILLNAWIAGTRHFHVMCNAFRRSSGLEEEIALWGNRSLKSRMLIVSAMTLAVVWPSLGLRRGWLHVEDSKAFPGYLKRVMKVSSSLIFMGLGAMAFLVAFVKVTKG